jgi:hypothetical protein
MEKVLLDKEVTSNSDMFDSFRRPHRGIGGSSVFVNYAVWESSTQLKKALNNTELEAMLSDYLASTVISPHIFKKVAVPRICVE